MYLSSVPPEASTSSVIGVRYSPRNAASASGGIPSENRENPRMSENSTVSSLRSPPSLARAGSARMRSTTGPRDVLREHRAQLRLLAALGREPADGRRDRARALASTDGTASRDHHAAREHEQRERDVRGERGERDQRRHPRRAGARAAAAPRTRSAHSSRVASSVAPSPVPRSRRSPEQILGRAWRGARRRRPRDRAGS